MLAVLILDTLVRWRMEKAMTPHSSTLAWKIPWTEEPGRLQSMGSLRVGHNWATSLSCIGEENGNPLQCSCPENPRDGGAWWGALYGVTQSWTWLKRPSSSSQVKESPFIPNLLRVYHKLINLSFFQMFSLHVFIGSWACCLLMNHVDWYIDVFCGGHLSLCPWGLFL